MDIGGTIMSHPIVKNLHEPRPSEVNLFPHNKICANDCLNCEYYDCTVRRIAITTKTVQRTIIDRCTLFRLTNISKEIDNAD